MSAEFELNLEDFIPVYPDQDDPAIQRRLAAKQEFREVSGRTREPTPAQGQYFRHQKAFIRFLQIYDRIFNLSEPGTGKTCSFVGLAEMVRNNPKEFGMYRRVYVLEKGPSTSNDFKRQIACACTPPETYDKPVEPGSTLTVRGRRRRVNEEIKKWYSVMTYGQFRNLVRDVGTSREAIQEYFDGCIFFIDEVHNLRNAEADEKFGDLNLQKENKGTSEIYKSIFDVLHTARRIKVCVGSATPAINDPSEMAPCFNLLLDTDHQLPTDWDYQRVTLEQLEPVLRGRITFVRGLETGAYARFIGIPIQQRHLVQFPISGQQLGPIARGLPQPEVAMQEVEFPSQMNVVPVVMSEFQQRTYGKVQNERGTFHSARRQASNFVFPDPSLDLSRDGSYGGVFARQIDGPEPTSGFGYWVESKTPNQYNFRTGFAAWLRQPYLDAKGQPVLNEAGQPRINLEACSAKFAFIIFNELNHPSVEEIKRSPLPGPGCSFVFLESFTGGGAVTLGLCLEAIAGFSRYNDSASAFVNIADEAMRGGGSFCAGSSRSRVIRPEIKRSNPYADNPRDRVPYRYGLLTNETPVDVMNNMLELFNSEENVDGSYLRMIIGSPVTRDGINLFNVVRAYLAAASWHPSGMYQALSRFLRAVSHDNLLRKRQAEAMEEARLRGEADACLPATVDVDIYRLAAVTDASGEEAIRNSIDLEMYHYAEGKDLLIRRLIRLLKQIAWDCIINHRRNVRPDDVDYSVTCDYDVCDYACVSSHDGALVASRGISEEEVDYSTYDILFTEEQVSEIITHLTETLKARGQVALDEIIGWVREGRYRERFVYLALDRLLQRKGRIFDRFGFGNYASLNGSSLFLQRDFPVGQREGKTPSVYGQQVAAIQLSSFQSLISQKRQGSLSVVDQQMRAIIDAKMVETPEGLAALEGLLNSLHITSKSELLERAIIHQVLGSVSSLDEYILRRYSFFYFSLAEPRQAIAEASARLSRVAPKSGHLPSSLEQYGSSETVYINTLYTSAVGLRGRYGLTQSVYNVAGRIRILKPSEATAGGLQFRDANEYEVDVYQRIAKERVAQIVAPFAARGIYGNILSDGKFRIVRPEEGGRGHACLQLNKANLITILMREDYILPEVEAIPLAESSREALITALIAAKHNSDPETYQTLTDEQLRLLLRWHRYPLNRKETLCQILQEHFAATGKLLVV